MKGKQIASIFLMCGFVLVLGGVITSCGKSRIDPDHDRYVFSPPPDRLDVWGLVMEARENGETVVTVEKLKLTMLWGQYAFSLFSEGDMVTLERASVDEPIANGQVVHMVFNVFENTTLENLMGGDILETWDSIEDYKASAAS